MVGPSPKYRCHGPNFDSISGQKETPQVEAQWLVMPQEVLQVLLLLAAQRASLHAGPAAARRRLELRGLRLGAIPLRHAQQHERGTSRRKRGVKEFAFAAEDTFIFLQQPSYVFLESPGPSKNGWSIPKIMGSLPKIMGSLTHSQRVMETPGSFRYSDLGP